MSQKIALFYVALSVVIVITNIILILTVIVIVITPTFLLLLLLVSAVHQSADARAEASDAQTHLRRVSNMP